MANTEKVTKVTKVQKFATVREILVKHSSPDELIQFIDHEIELLNKKSASRKPTKAQKVTSELRDIVLDVLGNATKPMTIVEIQGCDDRLKVFNGEVVSNQRIASILTKLGDGVNGEGIVCKKVVKRKNYYAIDTIIDVDVSTDW